MDLDKSLTYYIAGPMSGLTQFNFPLFEKVAAFLRGRGYTIISPHELDGEKERAEAWKSEAGKCDEAYYWKCLIRDVDIVTSKVQGIIFLPNWWMSRGAKLEAFVGLLTNKRFGLFVQAGAFDPSTDGTYPEDDVLVAGKGYVRYILREFAL